jgi:hypothetical protein
MMSDEEDPIRHFLRSALTDGQSRAPQQLAQAFHAERAKAGDPPDAWRRYLLAFKQQAMSLAKQGEIEFIRKGKPVPLDEIKGVVRLRRKLSSSGA